MRHPYHKKAGVKFQFGRKQVGSEIDEVGGLDSGGGLPGTASDGIMHLANWALREFSWATCGVTSRFGSEPFGVCFPSDPSSARCSAKLGPRGALWAPRCFAAPRRHLEQAANREAAGWHAHGTARRGHVLLPFACSCKDREHGSQARKKTARNLSRFGLLFRADRLPRRAIRRLA
jgi:hypothetical protein